MINKTYYFGEQGVIEFSKIDLVCLDHHMDQESVRIKSGDAKLTINCPDEVETFLNDYKKHLARGDNSKALKYMFSQFIIIVSIMAVVIFLRSQILWVK